MAERIRPSAPRLAPLDPGDLDEETRRIAGAEPFNIFRTLAHHPKLLKRWLVFGNHVLAKSTLPERERELAILRTGWRCAAAYEFGQHTVIGRSAGIGEEEIAALCRPVADGAWSSSDAVLLTAVDELHDDQCISDTTWEALRATWSTEQLLDLIFAVGQYTLVSMALNSLGVELDDGVPGFPS